MNKDSTLRLDKTLGVIENIVPESTYIEKITGDVRDGCLISSNITSEDVDKDYKYQRENLYSLIERGQDAIDGILELAKESEHPRTYEVALNGIKQVAEVTEKLGELQEKMRKLKEVPNHAPRTVNNALYVGSTAELQKMLKEIK
jgi:ArsR family metal-binding transcriptional regulator